MIISFSIHLPLVSKKVIFRGLKTKGQGSETAFSSFHSVANIILTLYEQMGSRGVDNLCQQGDIPAAPAPWEPARV